MTISSKIWDRFVDGLRRINEKAAELVSTKYNSLLPLTPEKTEILIDYCYAIATKYGEAATEYAAQMYDACAGASGKTLPPAVPAETATYDEVAIAVQGSMKVSVSPEVVSAAVGRMVKMAGVDTTMQNALRDGAEWAWIPRGYTCAYCLMLASRGWQHASKQAIKNGHAEHIHANCDCTYAIRFDDSTVVAGYEPDQYRAMYDNADGRTGKQKLNSMRRDMYARNKEIINEQKRDAYEKRVERESSKAEEIDID